MKRNPKTAELVSIFNSKKDLQKHQLEIEDKTFEHAQYRARTTKNIQELGKTISMLRD